jgi:DNA helicase-2/ATP-dependent DNA helicase PcrA
MSTYKKSNEESGSYWADWFASRSDNIGECNRLAYVAFSRAKQLLVLGVPNPRSSPIDESQRTILTNAGFEIMSV